jgi:hypothetical protein
MAGQQAKKKGIRSKNKQYKRKIWLSRRDKDIDQIQDELKAAVEVTGKPEIQVAFDDELPGCGQFYCSETAKHFISQVALDDHKKTKFFKRRVKELKEEQHNQKRAEWAAGMTKEVLPSAHPVS